MDDKKAAEIVYERIKSAYGGLNNDELGKKLAGVGGQAIYKRKKAGNYDKDEIIAAFPDINREWLHSDNISDLQKMDVRQQTPGEPVVERADQVDLNNVEASDEAKRQIVERIESLLRLLKDSL